MRATKRNAKRVSPARVIERDRLGERVASVNCVRKGAIVLDIPESHSDLLGVDVAALATISDDGFPQATMLWFNVMDGELKLCLNSARAKTKNLRRRPECTLLILDREIPQRYLEIRARARVEPDDDYEFADRFTQKYGGVDLRSVDQPGQSRVEVTLEPVRVFAVDMRR
jgi:PPOX class probable F420-dependent enzyme